MKSWYNLTKKEAYSLENEFISKEMGKYENDAMHIQVIIGIFVLLLCTVILTISIMLSSVKWYIFISLLLGIILGILIIVLATIEYHNKFNSWLEVTHKIIRK